MLGISLNERSSLARPPNRADPGFCGVLAVSAALAPSACRRAPGVPRLNEWPGVYRDITAGPSRSSQFAHEHLVKRHIKRGLGLTVDRASSASEVLVPVEASASAQPRSGRRRPMVWDDCLHQPPSTQRLWLPGDWAAKL